MRPGWGSVPRPLPRSPPRARGWAQGSGVGAGVMLITALGRQVCPSPGLPVERDKGFCPLPSSRFCPPPHPVPPVPPPVGAAFLPPRAAAAPGRVSPPAPPRAAPSRPRRAAEGGGGRGVGAERKIKRGEKRQTHTPQKSQVPLLPGPPPPPPCSVPFGCEEWESPLCGSRGARVGRCRDTHGPSGPFTHRHAHTYVRT